jgi:hypothetical protein
MSCALRILGLRAASHPGKWNSSISFFMHRFTIGFPAMLHSYNRVGETTLLSGPMPKHFYKDARSLPEVLCGLLSALPKPILFFSVGLDDCHLYMT